MLEEEWGMDLAIPDGSGYSPNQATIQTVSSYTFVVQLWMLAPIELIYFTLACPLYTLNCTPYTVCYTDLEKTIFFVNSEIWKCTFGGGKNV